MKLSHAILYFLLLLIPICVTGSIQARYAYSLSVEQLTLDKTIDNAVYSAAQVLGTGETLEERESAIDAFYQSIYAGLGAASPRERSQIEDYIPVVAVMESHGLYVYSYREYTYNNVLVSVKAWSEEYPYYADDGYFLYRFIGDDEVHILDYKKLMKPPYTGKELVTSIHSLLDQEWYYYVCRLECFPFLIMRTEQQLQNARNNSISDTFKRYTALYSQRSNPVAEQIGIEYSFIFPSNSESTPFPSIFALYQGSLIDPSDAEKNRFTVSAGYKTSDMLYIITKENDHLFYHNTACPKLRTLTRRDKVGSVYSLRDAAKIGAYACDSCFPDSGIHR